jgi:hypothetical protein
MKVSKNFKIALKLDPRPAYKVAQLAGICPVWLSKAINNAIPLKANEHRLVMVARILGVPDHEVFEQSGFEQIEEVS